MGIDVIVHSGTYGLLTSNDEPVYLLEELQVKVFSLEELLHCVG